MFLPTLTLSMDDLLHPFETVLSLHVSIDATSKRKVDGSKAATRLGSSATEKWGNERFRQTMLLVREFRMEWPSSSLLTADDVESIRSLLDCARLAGQSGLFKISKPSKPAVGIHILLSRSKQLVSRGSTLG